jgi:hypothetical protein
MGKKVKDIVQDQYLEAGEYSYAWDGRNEQGKQVGNGIYFVSLRAGKEFRRLKLTYIARSAVVSSELKITDEIREKDITFPMKLTELSLDKQEALLGGSCESFENVKQLARYITKAFPQIETALRNAIAHSTDEMDHKVNLPSFIFKGTAGDGRLINTILCETNGISKLELRSVVNLIDRTPYIWIPPECKEWTKEELPVIALSPASKEAMAVWACNINGEEFLLGLEKPPEFPAVVITAEPPPEPKETKGLNKSISDPLPEPRGLRKAPPPDLYELYVDIYRYWGKWDGWPCSPYPELYSECIVANDGDRHTIVQSDWHINGQNYPHPKCGKNNGSSNCDCADIPEEGDNGYYYGTPGNEVGHTSLEYPEFYELIFWDDDDFWCGDEDDRMETIPLTNYDPPPTTWYYGEEGSCKNVDVYMESREIQ